MQRRFSSECKLESALLELDHHNSIAEAARAMNVSKSTMEKWVNQLRGERQRYYSIFTWQSFGRE
ncbi:helix-turn-helix domain-containing protein [Xenorhabdus sp. Reich]|uniref:Helix-turn-helix domain-containing protein n=1 Tax=Xenorhabdus littoralis TaxID=2582835 RepID=A0ABU4SJY8_9GAMM|nr:helix-turn-helix domain-containing protein [Xenorhabdus sp. Reich]